MIHPISPVFDGNSELLILGSFPSVKSRESRFFYGHPQNRFWRVLAALYGEAVPGTIEEKTALLLRRHIALWDVVHSCDIVGSSDASIRSVVPNDLSVILGAAPVRRVFTNGGTADALYRKYCEKQTGLPATRLPSTSPANARMDLDALAAAWHVLLEN